MGILFAATVIISCSQRPSSTSGPREQRTSELFGEASDCFAGTTVFPYGGVEVFVFSVERNAEKSKELRWFQETRPFEKPEGWAEGHRRVDQFLKLVKRRGDQAKRAKTDAQGRYRIGGLPSGKEYVVIGIIPPDEDSEEGFLDRRTGKLPPESTPLDLWGSDIPKEKCTSKSK
jgi:hypothetical protein